MSNLDLIKTENEIAEEIALKFKAARKKKHISQKQLSLISGISYGTIKRFEQTGEISFVSLIAIAKRIDELDCISSLFNKKPYTSIEEVINDK